MHQLTQKLKGGEMTVQEVPCPQLESGTVLVKNHFSLISPGTEGATVKTARKSMIGKARERPAQVKQVIDVLRRQGPVQTYRAVMKKLEAYSALGYSCSGEVIDVGARVTTLAKGDLVACSGVGYANHAEIVAVPENLCVRLPENANVKHAAYNTLGAVALQGIRQADLRLGESCAVIGLGLLGHLTCLMLRASGVCVAGIDVDAWAVAKAREHCVDVAFERDAAGVAESLLAFSHGVGMDAVIITAGTSSLDPINFAGEIARKRGTVVVVGAVPTGFERDPHYYRKELQLRMSCSYGPGRYDPDYEEKGVDYPVAYVRWTENRNMLAFQELLQSRKINVDYLTTHELPLDKAPKAYDMIMERSESFLGIVLAYDVEKPLARQRITVSPSRPAGKVGIAFIGAGSYAQGNLLPNLPEGISRKTVMTRTGTTSKRVAERFQFEACTSDPSDIFENSDINTVFVATRHDSHAYYVQKAIAADKHVFVEKPLCLTEDSLREIEHCLQSSPDSCPLHLMVGFNRRFSPLAELLKERLADGPKAMIYRVNAGAIPRDSWIHDPDIGGGRIIGEVCHFIDFLTWMCDSLPVRVHAVALDDPQNLHDTVSISLEFQNGSTGMISYFANGSKQLDKEYVEVYSAGATGILRDFRSLEIHGSGKPYKKKLMSQNKGQREMIRTFIQSVRDGGAPPIPREQLFAVSLASFRVLDSLRLKEVQTVDWSVVEQEASTQSVEQESSDS